MSVALDKLPLTFGGRLEEPLYFRSGDHTLFGWLHGAGAAQTASVGLVICQPFGYESICSHRSMRAFAAAAAAAGVPTLRFDYGGTGDSEDLEPGVDQLAAWMRDIHAAIHELQRCTGVRHVCLLGIRLGALLATLAAPESDAVCALIVIAPVISGRRYLHELRLVQMAASSVAVVAPKPGTDDTGLADAESFEISGFSLPPATTNAIARSDLMKLAAPPAAHVLVIDRTDLPGARAWADVVGGLGAQIEYRCFPGLVEMIWTAPHFAAVPQAMVAGIRDWLTGLEAMMPARVASGDVRRREQRAGMPSTMSLSCDPLPEMPLTERAIFFASEPSLFGIVTEPPSGEARRRGVILVNDGATHHIGANRVNVSLARRWAQHGYVVLRMDLAGLGDSTTRAGRPDNEVFPPAALDDMSAAIKFLRDSYDVRDVTIGGLCAGAYHALRGAVAALPVNRILMVNPQNYFWKDGMTLSELQLADVVRNPGVYRERLLSAASWKRLLTGQVNVWRVARVHVQRCWLALESTVRDAIRRLHIRLPQDLGRELEEITKRGVQLVFVFSRGEAGIDLLKIQAGSSMARLGKSCRVHIIDGADHIFSQRGARRALENVLSDELFARRADSSGSPSRLVGGRPG